MNIKQNIPLLAWFNFFTDFVLFAPVAIIYFAQVTGSYAFGMSIFSAAYVSSALFEVPTGVISDLVGRKKTAMLGALSAVLCVILYAVGGSYAVLFIGALFQGMSRAFYSGNNDALLHDTLRDVGKKDEYAEYLGKTSAMFQVALAISAIVGSLLAAKSFAVVMWLSVIPQACAFIISLFLVEPKSETRADANIFAHLGESIKQFQGNARLRALTMASVFRFSLGETSFFLRSAFVHTLWPLWAIGISYAISNVGAAASFFFSGKIIKKYGSRTVLVFEIVSNRIVNLLALVFPTIVSPALMASSSLTFGVGMVTIDALMQKEFTDRQRATMSSLATFAGSIAFGIFSIVLGAVADRYGVRVALIVAHILLLVPLVFYQRAFR